MLSAAFALIVTVPLSVAPGAGEVMLTVGGVVSPGTPDIVTRTGIQSREKSRLIELAAAITRTRKFESLSCVRVQLLPQVSAAPPSTYDVMPVVSAGVDFAAVQLAPPFQESCTH